MSRAVVIAAGPKRIEKVSATGLRPPLNVTVSVKSPLSGQAAPADKWN